MTAIIHLADLEPEWVWDYNVERRSHRSSGEPAIISPQAAQGIWFLCPACFLKNNGPIGTHAVLIWFANRGVPEEAEPAPRWSFVSGTGFHDLTLSPSIDLTKDRQGKITHPDEWHGHVQNGMIT